VKAVGYGMQGVGCRVWDPPVRSIKVEDTVLPTAYEFVAQDSEFRVEG